MTARTKRLSSGVLGFIACASLASAEPGKYTITSSKPAAPVAAPAPAAKPSIEQKPPAAPTAPAIASNARMAADPAKAEPTSTNPTVAAIESETADPEKAKELFAEGRRLATEALYEQACPLFEQSLALESRASTQFNLAECWEKLGRLASAQALYFEVADAMHEAGDATRENVARRRAELLTPRLCGLSIEPQKPIQGLEISLAGKPFDSKRWGTVEPIDAATYTVQATAPGRKPWSTEVEVEACPTLVSVTVPMLEPLPTKAIAITPKPKAAKAQPRHSVPQTYDGAESSRFPLLPVAIAGAGAGALVFGTIFASKYGSKNDDAKAVCPQGVGCSRSQVEAHAKLVDEAKTARTWGFVGFGVGGAALVTAAVLYFTGDYGAHGPTYGQWRVSPFSVADRDTWGATVSADF